MRATAARDFLMDLSVDRAFERTANSTRDRKIADALCSVGDELSARALGQVVKKIANSINWTLLFDVARKGPSDPTGEVVAKAIGKRKTLTGVFFKHAHRAGAGAETAQLVVDFAKSPHLPSLIKRLAKQPPPSKVIVVAARKTLSAKPTKDWFDLVNFLPCCALLGLLLKSEEPVASALVDRVTASLERQLSDHEIHDPAATIERLRKGLGARPAKKAAKAKAARTKRPSKGASPTNPAIALAQEQGFSVAAKSDWRAKVWLAKGEPNEWFGAMQEETQVLLQLNAKRKPHWEITVRLSEGYDQYHNTTGRVTQDDLGLPTLNDLREVPSWLPKAAKKLETRFTPSSAKISAGRHRKLIEELRAWLESGG